MARVIHSFIPVCFCISILNHFQRQIFVIVTVCLYHIFGKEKYTTFSKSWVRSNFAFNSKCDCRILAAMDIRICCMWVQFYISNWDEYLGFIWGEDSLLSQYLGILLSKAWKCFCEGIEMNLSGYWMWYLKAAYILLLIPAFMLLWKECFFQTRSQKWEQ